MICIGATARALLLASAVGIAAVAWTGSAPAAVPPSSSSAGSGTVVLRGSDDAAMPPASGNGAPSIVLRGSPPSPPRLPVATSACPGGYIYDPSYGCALPGYTYEPYDYGYWPYYGWDWFYPGGSHRRFAHGFAGAAHRRASVRFAHPAVNGLGHGVAHIGGFGHR